MNIIYKYMHILMSEKTAELLNIISGIYRSEVY